MTEPDEVDGRWISAPEAAFRLGLSMRSLRCLVEEGTLPGYLMPLEKRGVTLRFLAADVDAHARTAVRTA